jgi:hypothetical protein
MYSDPKQPLALLEPRFDLEDAALGNGVEEQLVDG